MGQPACLSPGPLETDRKRLLGRAGLRERGGAACLPAASGGLAEVGTGVRGPLPPRAVSPPSPWPRILHSPHTPDVGHNSAGFLG